MDIDVNIYAENEEGGTTALHIELVASFAAAAAEYPAHEIEEIKHSTLIAVSCPELIMTENQAYLSAFDKGDEPHEYRKVFNGIVAMHRHDADINVLIIKDNQTISTIHEHVMLSRPRLS